MYNSNPFEEDLDLYVSVIQWLITMGLLWFAVNREHYFWKIYYFVVFAFSGYLFTTPGEAVLRPIVIFISYLPHCPTLIMIGVIVMIYSLAYLSVLVFPPKDEQTTEEH